MNYFIRKDIVRILAEKPDMMSGFPEYVLSTRQLDEMARIPGIALCDITMLSDHAAVERMCASRSPGAVLPAVVYSGIERVLWSDCDGSVRDLKKTLARYLHVHMLPPVVLGAPLFRSALCMYAAVQSQQHICSAFVCAACLFYRAAVCIPLCKQCGITRICQGGIAPCCLPAVEVLQAPLVQKYCAILPRGYGITLDMALATAPVEDPALADDQQCAAAPFVCCARLPGTDCAGQVLSEDLVRGFFETFAIPFASNAISLLLSGRAVDFIGLARAFLPAGRGK